MDPLRLGVFGGTFNPIHLGHIHLAGRVRRLFDLDQVLFVVATEPPHKRSEKLVPLVHRYAMVCLALARRDAFVPSLVELEPPASPYSLDTLGKIVRRQGGAASNLYFVAGGDSLLEVGEWHRSRELLTSYNFIFAVRAGVSVAAARSLLPADVQRRMHDLRGSTPRQVRTAIRATEKSGENTLFLVDVGVPDISASRIRGLVSGGKAYDHLVPPLVSQYIQKLNLYGER